jgi:hypothetical protein
MFPLTSTIPGLGWAYRVTPGLGAERLPSDCTTLDAMPGDGFVWLHLNLADTRLPAFLEQFPGLTAPVLSAITTHDTHVALTVDDGMLYGTLIVFQREFDATHSPTASSSPRGCSQFALSTRCAWRSRRMQPAMHPRCSSSRFWLPNSSAG